MRHLVIRTICLAAAVVLYSLSGAALAEDTVGSSSLLLGFAGHNLDHALVVPQIVVGQHYTTTIQILNLGDSAVITWVIPQSLVTVGRISFYAQDGSPLLVNLNGGTPVSHIDYSLTSAESRNYELSGTGLDTPGWAIIDIDELASGSGWGYMDGQTITRGMRLMANVFYTYTGEHGAISRVGVIPTMYVPGQFSTSIVGARSLDEFYTGVAIVNTGSSSAVVGLRLRDTTGNILAASQLPLGPGHQVAEFVNQLFSADIPSNFQGFLEMNSSADGIVAMGLLLRLGVLTSVPTSHYGQIKFTP